LTIHLLRCIVNDVDALELITLGRRLVRIGEDAIRGGSALPLPAGQALVLRDVMAHPHSSITDITSRTGLAQSIVSKAVARFREEGLVDTEPDPADGRRLLVEISAQHRREVARKGAVSVDDALAMALREPDRRATAEFISVLETVAERLRPVKPGPVLEQLRDHQPSSRQRA
jgi:DNA-binding MarR family transcriptional regulator